MSIANPSREQVIAAQSQLCVTVCGCLATVFLIHWLPKNVPDAVRLAYTVTYFASLLLLLYQFTRPFKQYLQMLFAWRYESAPDPLQRAWKTMVYSLSQLIMAPCILAGAFLSSVGLLTLSLWFDDLQVLEPLFNLVWWVSLCGMLLYPFAGGFLFQEVAQKARQLNHETELSTFFTPRPIAALKSGSPDDVPQPVEMLDGLKFKAGGQEWEWNDFVENCIVLGQLGSGKTSCVLNSILDGLLGSADRAGVRPGGLILDPKGLFDSDIKSLCRRYARIEDLLVLEPGGSEGIRWNPFDSDDDEYELAMRFTAVCRSLGTKDTNSSFWLTKSTMFMQYALELIRLTNPPGEPPTLTDINDLVSSFTAIAERTDQLTTTDDRCHGCLNFFANEWATLAPETRTSVQAHLTGMLFPFLKEPYATQFSGRSSMRIAEMIDSGKILYLKMPTADRETMARTIGIFLKLEYYHEVLKRPRKDRPTFFFCDEFQKFFTAGSRDDRSQEKSDADTFRMSRESFHANIVATQNIGALGDQEVARTFLSNCLTGIFLRNPDEDTNNYASQLFSQDLVAMGGASHAAGGGKLRPIGGQQVSSHDQLYARCPPHRFRELAICSRNQPIPFAESFVFLGGRDESTIPVRKLKWKRHPLSLDDSTRGKGKQP